MTAVTTTEPPASLALMLRALKLPTVARHAEEVARLAEREGWTFERYVHHLVELEIHERRRRRIERHLKDSDLPRDKTLATLDRAYLPIKISKQLATLCEGGFVERGDNLLAFGLPGRGKTHLVCAIGYELIQRGYRVLFTATYALVQRLLAAKRDLQLEKELAILDGYDVVVCDDLGYIQQDRDEMEVLFTFLAERYERRSVIITTNQTRYAPSSRKFDSDPGPGYWGASTVGACALDQRTRWPRGGSCCFIKAATVGPWFTQRRRPARNGRRCRRSCRRS
jgi:DNA replication protein DnaC